MSVSLLNKVFFVGLVVAAAGVSVNSLSVGQEGKEKKAKGRLPTYYADLVSPEQREKIYAMQDRYAKQITTLNEQLNAIEKQRDSEIESVLTADQKEKLNKARDDGLAKKKKSAADKKSVEEGKASDSPEAKTIAPPGNKKVTGGEKKVK